MPTTGVLIVVSALAAALGTLGGLGGAVFLVPALVLLGVEPVIAAPIGILSVGAGSLAAAPRQLGDGVVHHRLGVVLEAAASAGAIAGALLSDQVSGTALSVGLALVAFAAAAASMRSRGLRNRPRPEFTAELAGEWPGSLAGAYQLGSGVVPYRAHRVPLGLVAMLLAGLVSGLAGVGGGFIKTPAMSEIMRIPVKVAAATTTFTVGITAATTLVVFSFQDRLDLHAGATAVLGSLIGGVVGVRLQSHLPPGRVRAVLAGALVVVGAILLVTAR
jgi:uncharacterized membrane protein YfcA